LLCSPITSNSGFMNSVTAALPVSATPEAASGRRYTAASWPATSRHTSRMQVSEVGSLSRRARCASTLWKCGAAASGWEARSVVRRRDSRLAGEVSPGESGASALSSMGTTSGGDGARWCSWIFSGPKRTVGGTVGISDPSRDKEDNV
jgi:hypothetical protein